MLKKTLLALIFLVLLLASCGGGNMLAPESGADNYTFYEEQEAADLAIAPGPYDDAQSANIANSTSEADAERMVIQNADLAIVVEDPNLTLESTGKMAESMGGFIVESYLYQQTLSNGVQVPYATITIRVPAEKLDEAISQIKAGAVQVESVNVSGQDVTSQYTDLGSRLKNLEAAEAQLQEIMDNAQKTEDVLDVFNELVAVREQIEIIKGQMKYYEEAAALSKISVSITADEAVLPIQVGGWQLTGVAKEAIETLIRTLQFLVSIGIWVVLCVLPIGLLIGLPLFFIGRAIIRKRRKSKSVDEAIEEVLP